MFNSEVYKYKNRDEIIKNLIITPITEAYNLIKRDKTNITNKEDVITNTLVLSIKEKTSISEYIKYNHIKIIVRQQIPVDKNDTVSPDLEFIIFEKNLFSVELEAKRIYAKNKWSISEYLSDEGIGRFISGKYSKENEYAGMISYIQNGNLGNIASNLFNGIKNVNCNTCIIISSNFIYCSVHNRKPLSTIIIYHLILFFS